MLLPEELEFVLYGLALRHRESRDAERSVRRLARVPHRGFGDYPGLRRIRARVSAIVMRIRQVVEFQSHARDGIVGTWHDEQAIVVELLI